MTNYGLFAEHFSDFQDNYVVIGGTACELVMADAGFKFRATRDIDMVIVAEEINEPFGQAFWKFIDEGGYQSHRDREGENYYRFDKPTNDNYPKMIELFCRKPLEDFRKGNGTFTPIHIGEDITSLSAIVLNEAYVDILNRGKIVLQNLTVLKSEYLIIFKARAHIDLKQKQREGYTTKSHDIKKHLLDVIRILAILDIDELLQSGELSKLSEELRADLNTFINEIDQNERVSIQGLNEKEYILREPDEIIRLLKQLFSL